jgi:hypothetical protein
VYTVIALAHLDERTSELNIDKIQQNKIKKCAIQFMNNPRLEIKENISN